MHVVDDDVLAIEVEAHELSSAVAESFLDEALWGVRGRDEGKDALSEVGAGGIVSVVAL